MNRRQLLAAVGGLGVPLGTNGTPEPHPYVEVPPCPEIPEPLTRETVGRFAPRFERAYANRILDDRTRDMALHSSSLSVSIHDDPEVATAGDGWVVRFLVVGPGYGIRPPGGGAISVHLGYWTAHYFVTDDTVVRAAGDPPIEPVDPREHGTAVQCPPSWYMDADDDVPDYHGILPHSQNES